MTDSYNTKKHLSYLPDLSPVTISERIDVMDILRGFALLGILFMNIEWFNRSVTELGQFDFSLTGFDYAAGWLVKVFIEGKFFKLFSLLFGMGFAVLLIRIQERKQPFVLWFVRRMLLLFAIGFAHMVFLWEGDIVHDYAITGLLLLGWILLLNTKYMTKLNQPKWFLRIGLTIITLPFIVATLAGLFFGATRDQAQIIDDWNQRIEIRARVDDMKKHQQETDTVVTTSKLDSNNSEVEGPIASDDNITKDEREMNPEELLQYKSDQRLKRIIKREKEQQNEFIAFTQESYWVATKYRVTQALDKLKLSPVMALVMLFPLFMIGFWFISSGTLKAPENHTVLFKNMALIGLGFGLFMTLIGIFPLTHPATKDAIEIKAVAQMVSLVGQYFMAAGYLGAIVLLSQFEKAKRFLLWLAPLGRMALTNYIMHSIILSSVFFGYAGGMYGLISRGPQMLIVVAIILFQILLSRWWLMNFLYGPLEWLWRSLTYLKVQPIRVNLQLSVVR